MKCAVASQTILIISGTVLAQYNLYKASQESYCCITLYKSSQDPYYRVITYLIHLKKCTVQQNLYESFLEPYCRITTYKNNLRYRAAA